MFSLSGRRPVPTPPPSPPAASELSVARDRIHACVRALDNIMRDERARGTECDAALFNRLLDARNLLAPSSALPLRPTTPVIPGRAS